MQTNTLKKTNIDDIINKLWFANIPVERNHKYVEDTLMLLDECFPHLEVKSIKSNQDYTNIITKEIRRLIDHFGNSDIINELTNKHHNKFYCGISFNTRSELACYTKQDEITLQKKIVEKNSFGLYSDGEIKHTIKKKVLSGGKESFTETVIVNTPNTNQFWCSFELDGEFINIHIGSNWKPHNYKISCTNIKTENMKIIKHFFHTFTKVLTLPEVKDCCSLVNDIIQQECGNDIDKICDIDTFTRILKLTQDRMLEQHPEIAKILDKCPQPYFLEKKSSILSNDDGNNTTWLCNICNLCSSCLSSIYDKNTQKDV